MSKTMKKSIYAISLIILICITLFGIVRAYEVGGEVEITPQMIASGTNGKIFCIEPSQNIVFNTWNDSISYKVAKKIEVDFEGNIKINGTSLTDEDDDKKIAYNKLFAIINSNLDECRNDEDDWNKALKSPKGKCIWKCFSENSIYFSDWGTIENYTEDVHEDYDDIITSSSDYSYSGTILILNTGENDSQNLMLVETMDKQDKPEIPEVPLTFKKTKWDGTTALNGAKIEISKPVDSEGNDNSNVENLSSNTLTSAGAGEFGTITVTPKENTGTFNLKVTETTVPSGYQGVGTQTLEVEYDTENGDVKTITSSNTTYIPNVLETATDKTVIIKNAPKVKLNFKKQNFEGNGLKGAEISIVNEENAGSISKNTLTSDSNGNFEEIKVFPYTNSGTFKLRIKETAVPNGYKGFPNEIILEVTYNTNTGEVITVTNESGDTMKNYVPDIVETKEDKTIIIRNRPNSVKLNFKKEDFLGNRLDGATISVIRGSGVALIEGLNPGFNTLKAGTTTQFEQLIIYIDEASVGEVSNPDGTPNLNRRTFLLELTEREAPNGYEGLPQTVVLKVEYNIYSGKITKITNETEGMENYVPDITTNNPGTITNPVIIKNKPISVKIDFKKQDFGGNPRGGAKIKIEALENVKGILGPKEGEHTLTSNEDGVFANGTSTGIKVYPDVNNGVFKIKIKEIKAPDGYQNLGREVILTVTYNTEDGEVIGIKSDYETYVPEVTKGNTVIIKNSPIVELNFVKQNFGGNPLGGAKIEISLVDGGNVNRILGLKEGEHTLTSNEAGEFGEIEVYPKNNTGTFKIKITEEIAPQGYQKLKGEVTLIVTYNIANGNVQKIESDSKTYVPDVANSKTVVIKNSPIVKLNFIKNNFIGQILPGATIQIEREGNVDEIVGLPHGSNLLTSGNDGSFGEIEVYPSNPTGEFKLKITETSAPNGYQILSNEVILTVTYNADGTIDNIASSDAYYIPNVTESNSVIIRNMPVVEMTFKKEDFNNRALAGASITIKGDGNVQKIYKKLETGNVELKSDDKLLSDSNGNFGTIEIHTVDRYPSEDTSNFILIVKETDVPTGYKGLPEEVSLEVVYNVNTGDIISVESNKHKEYVPDVNGNKPVIIKNKPQIEELVLLKVDSQDEAKKLDGVTFKITCTNIESVAGDYDIDENGKLIINNVITQGGKVSLKDLVIHDENELVTITIEETSSIVGYKRITGPITIILKREGQNYTQHYSETTNVEPKEFSPGNIDIVDHIISLTVKNIPVMNLGGIVWEDAQSGIKDASGPDGKLNNNEQGMAGIKVELYKADGTLVTGDVYGNGLMTKTSSGGELNYALYNGGTSLITLGKGQYVFPNIEKGEYYVRFTYDGINYETVNLSSNVYANNNESKADEDETERKEFNDKFKTISSGKATGSEGDIPLTYTDTTPTNAEVKTSSLVTKDNNGNVLSNYAMTAKTSNYLKSGDNWIDKCWSADGTIKTDTYAQDINCGLTKRNFDLAIGMDIDSAKLTINGKDTTYNYNQIINSGLTNPNNDVKLDNMLEGISSKLEEGQTYNLYLYTSDYNYRISDYQTSIGFGSGVTESEDSSKIVENETDKYKELRAFITYKVILKNQTTQEDVQVNELAYYYDDNYTFVSATKADGTPITFENDSNLPQLGGKTSAKVSGFATNLGNDQDYRQELYFTFEVKKDYETGFLVKDIECANLVEIISYTTTEGFVDNDSVPKNIVTDGSIRYEDDTDKAKGIKLTISQERERTITGTVFDDADKDGIKNGDDTVVNDVIVQLIEIKKIGENYYEYIWQETRSGKDQVKTTARNGYAGTEYFNTVQAGSGMYEFKDFIPGDYIIRFIYGDGRTLDVNSQEHKNTAEYNGQDYKSTVDKNYKEQFYNDVMYNSTNANTEKYSENSSVARDNEARRLEVMTYSTTIDKEKGVDLANKTTEVLDNTWMVAETSMINVPGDADDISITQDSTNVSYTNIENAVVFNTVNFGLTLRPQTKLVLEKHITGLKITPNGIGVQPIIDAKADIGTILEGEVVNTTGITTGLAVIKSDRSNRGFWQVATDVEQLIQGAELEVEYTYVLKNEGEKDYLSTILVNAYEGYKTNEDGTRSDEALGMSYQDYLEILKYDTRGKTNSYGTYLGQVYYRGLNEDGSIPTTDAEVSSRVETLEEAINNDLKFSEGTHFEIKEQEQDKLVYGVEGNPKTEKINTVVENTTPTAFLTTEGRDYSKTIKLTKTLASVSGGEFGVNIPSYIAEITTYSNAAGRRDMSSEPENLSYVHSEDTDMNLSNSWLYDYTDGNTYETQNKESIPQGATNIREANEEDEFWGETIIITKPTGEDKLTPMQIALITISSTAVLGIGIVLIKRYVLKK